MFNWLKPLGKRKVQDRSKTLGSHYLQDSALRQQINRIQMLVGVTREDFQALYVNTLERYVSHISIEYLPTDRSVFVELLDNVILALKKRRGYLLPLGSDSETSFRERETWTFAVFAAALFKQMDPKTRFDSVKIVLPPLAFSWLERNEVLFDVWQRYLQGDGSENVFTEIVGDKSVCANADSLKSCLDTPVSREQETVVNIVSDTTGLILTHHSKDTLKPPHFRGHDFWSWLKEGITTQTLAYNQIDSMIHGVELGLFICMPAAVELFFSDQVKRHTIDINTVTLAQRIELTKAIKKHEGLVRNALGSRTHVYCRGPWQDRKLLSGFVMKREVLFASDFSVPINPNLVIDPVAGM